MPQVCDERLKTVNQVALKLAIKQAPAIEARVPITETPPDNPLSNGLKFKIERGGCELKTPISDAHVSARCTG